LVAVSKTFNTEHIIAAYAAGQKIFGENRLQEALEKIEQLMGIVILISFYWSHSEQQSKVL